MTPAQKVGVIRGASAMTAAVILAAAPLVAKWEGERRATYFDLVGKATICFGHTGPEVRLGQTKTGEECRTLLAADLRKHAEQIKPCIPASTPEPSQAAFLVLAVNVGGGAVCGSSIPAKLKAGNVAAACATISDFNKITVAPSKPWPCPEELRRTLKSGQRMCIVPGLVNRRADELKLCLRGVPVPPGYRAP